MPTASTRRAFLSAMGLAAGGLAAGNALAQAPAAAATGPVRLLGIACSPRKGKSTTMAVQAALDAAKEAYPAIEIELVELAGLKVPGEVAAGVALEPGQADDFPKLAEKLADPRLGGLILGTPVYMGSMSSQCKALLERMTAVRKTWPLRDKVAGAIAVGGSKYGGQDSTITQIHAGLLRQDMIVVGEGRPSAHPGAMLQSEKDSVAGDTVGLASARSLGKRVAEVALKLAAK